jgi:hypothetical protein
VKADDVQQIRYADVLARLQTEIAAATATTTVDNQILDGLAPLRSRSSADFALALADAWAVLAEILGFHSARHHEEACLPMASELRSLIELSRLVGYRPDPGVAASASLAFTIDDSGAAPVVTIPVGTAVTSVPNPGEQPVTFETVQAISARPTFNVLQPKRSRLQAFATPPPFVLLAGTATNVAVGDGVVVPIGAAGHAFAIATSVTVRQDDTPVGGIPPRQGWTRVDLKVLPDETPSAKPVSVPLALWPAPVPRGPLLSALSPQGATILDTEQLRARRSTAGSTPPMSSQRCAHRRRDHNRFSSSAPRFKILGGSAREADADRVDDRRRGQRNRATGHDGSSCTAVHHLDRQLAQRLPQSRLPQPARTGGLLRHRGPRRKPARSCCATAPSGASSKRSASTPARALCSPSQAGRPSCASPTKTCPSSRSLRTTVYLAGELLPLAGEPITKDLAAHASNIALDDWVDGLAGGRSVAITGMSATHPGLAVAHVTELKAVRHELSPTGQTTIDLVDPLPDGLARESVRINANVAPATHGERRSEVLGSGRSRTRWPSPCRPVR